MWNSVFVAFLVIAGSTAFVFRDCDLKKCDKFKITGIRPDMAPNEQQLLQVCGIMLERFSCIDNSIKDCTGQDLEELSSSDNTTVADTSTMLFNLQRLGVDLCDEDSLLHASYVANVDCFNDFLRKPHPECLEEANTVYEAYIQAQKVLGAVKTLTEEAQDAECLITAHTVACATILLGEECGEVARTTLVEVMRRVRYMSLSMDVCTKEQFEMLKTGYLGFVELEEPRKSYFRQAFEAGKK
ncbi:hypothetical protein JTE90_010122 [Oedothorax gibbosus]|uniref:Uncharacterized protein n=1 Tax=Oedothorax gibbosus TaxID=931172 RepID=A0AAV6UGE2_9ARAC|nr:hypothetical protein JTE90_010122 [Oedothorax gibbosus]